MSTMAIVPCDGHADWCHVLEDFNLLCSSSTPPLAMATRAEDCLPIPAAPPGHQSRRNQLLIEASSGAAFAAADCLSSALMNLREDESYYLPMYSAPMAAVVGDQYCSDQLQPLPAEGAMTSLDDALLLPFSNIDLEAFDNADEHKAPLDQQMMIPPGAQTPIDRNDAGAHHQILPDHDQKPMSIEDYCFRPQANDGLEIAVPVRHHLEEHRQANSFAALAPPPPPSLPRPRGRRSDERSSAPAGKTRLDHIGFDELRKYFYMPITRAAREMNVGLTVLKKRCRELGVARWPHRKMKSLKSLIVNVQEMGNGMSPVAVQQELAALETYCALMEENPWIELTDRTKKLRQSCFKESYKRRRAASVNVMEMDHVYNFGQHHHHHQLPQPTSSCGVDDCNGQSTRFFGY